MQIPYTIKKRLCRYPALYKVIQCINGTSHLGVTGDTKLCIEGYPRSANSYAVNLIRAALIIENPIYFSSHAEKLIAHHTHRVATVKSAVSQNVPTYILLREPISAISSAIVKKTSNITKNKKGDARKILRRLLDRYIEFYKHIDRMREVSIVPFEDVINQPTLFVRSAIESIEINNKSIGVEENFYKIKDFAKESLRYWQHYVSNSSGRASELPNKEKEDMKEVVKDIINKSFSRSATKCHTKYTKLYERSIYNT